MQERFNEPNWFQSIGVYAPGSPNLLDTIEIGQVWDGSVSGHRRLRAQVVAQIEYLRDQTHLQYILWPPEGTSRAKLSLADRQTIFID